MITKTSTQFANKKIQKEKCVGIYPSGARPEDANLQAGKGCEEVTQNLFVSIILFGEEQNQN